jgi:hypothetical protein
MKCRRAEELWSDYLEGTLSPPLRKDLDEHLAECADCPPLLASFREVVETLEGLERPAPSPDLVERILAMTPRRVRSTWPARLLRFRPRVAPPLRPWAAVAAAAALTVLITTLDMPGPLGALGRQANRLGSQAYSFGLRLYHGTDRVIDELDLLRMTVGVAFEDRLDRLNERLRDLRKAQQKGERKQSPTSEKGSSLLLSREEAPATYLEESRSERRSTVGKREKPEREVGGALPAERRARPA